MDLYATCIQSSRSSSNLVRRDRLVLSEKIFKKWTLFNKDFPFISSEITPHAENNVCLTEAKENSKDLNQEKTS